MNRPPGGSLSERRTGLLSERRNQQTSAAGRCVRTSPSRGAQRPPVGVLLGQPERGLFESQRGRGGGCVGAFVHGRNRVATVASRLLSGATCVHEIWLAETSRDAPDCPKGRGANGHDEGSRAHAMARRYTPRGRHGAHAPSRFPDLRTRARLANSTTGLRQARRSETWRNATCVLGPHSPPFCWSDSRYSTMASMRRFTDSSDDPSRERANASPHTGMSGPPCPGMGCRPSMIR
jgi:hypothetical protein